MNDMIIIYTLVIFFIGMGALIPYIQAEMHAPSIDSSYSTDSIIGSMGGQDKDEDPAAAQVSYSAVKWWKVLGSVASMFLWTFGSIHWLIDLFLFVPLRILLLLTIARNIWVGGGG